MEKYAEIIQVSVSANVYTLNGTGLLQTPHKLPTLPYTTGSYSSLGLLGREAMFDYVETGRGSEEEEDEDTT